MGDAMHDIWNPWHGCKKISEGCENCYMYFQDKLRGRDGSVVFKTKNGFDYPLHKDRKGNFKIKSGETLRVCMNSDFFIEEADKWRNEAWEIMRDRRDVIFVLLTKRPERVEKCLPADWNDGWENIFFNVTAENQKRADERIPLLKKLPFKHKGVFVAPFIDEVSIEKYLVDGFIEQVVCGGENYDGARPCNFEWVKKLRNECEKYNVSFCFMETGTYFIKDKKMYCMPKKIVQSEMAYKSKMSFKGKPIEFKLVDYYGYKLNPQYEPQFKQHCLKCGSKQICNGCSYCSKCHFY